MNQLTTTSHKAAPIIGNDDDRAAFLVRVYQHVLAAVAAFGLFEVLLFTTGAAERLYDFFFGSGGRWLMMLAAFMVGQWFVGRAAADTQNPARQYGALVGTSVIYSLLFAPFLFYVYNVADSGATIGAAAVVTATGFCLLSVVGFVTRKDLSFLRPIVMWGFAAAMLLIIGGVFFGFNLGVWFSVAMIALSGAAILWETQTIVRHYPQDAYVVAAVGLFGSLMTMFWYVLRLFMQLSRD